MLYDASALMKCQVKKYSGLNFARKIRFVAPGISSKYGIVVHPLVLLTMD